MFPQFTTEVAAQRRQAFYAAADRRRWFGRRVRATAAEETGAVDTTSLARLVDLPVRLDGLLGDAPAASTGHGASAA